MRFYQGDILVYHDDPGDDMNAGAFDFYVDGILAVDHGKIVYSGPKDATPFAIDEGQLITYPNRILLAGFVDTHIHYPQIGMIASYGEQLLQWLEKYTFPAESRFSDNAYARAIAQEFIRELFRNGTTSALVFSTVHASSADILFEEALKSDMCLITGKTLMDRNAPDYLLDTPETAYSESKALIEKWHRNGRLRYAVTPRFAVTSTGEQLQAAGRLLREHPDVYMQTHLSENKLEIETVAKLFPDSNGYLDVYDRYGLAGDRSVFAHCVHLRDDEFEVMKARDSAIAYCPCSNLFLGSGLFDLEKARDVGIRMGIGTDVGGGNSFSVLMNLNEAYKVAQLRGQKLNPLQAFYYATLGGAKALSVDDALGTLKKGRYADFIVLNPTATPLMQLRMKNATTLTDRLFVLMMMGDDRCVEATYIAGKKVR